MRTDGSSSRNNVFFMKVATGAISLAAIVKVAIGSEG
jgi:hypothetical protein